MARSVGNPARTMQEHSPGDSVNSVKQMGNRSPSQTGKSRIAQKAFIYTAGNLLTRGLAFFLIPIYTRYLSPSDYGIVAAITVTEQILLVFYRLGLDGAAFRFYYDSQNEAVRKRIFFQASFGLFLFSLIVSGILTWWGQPLFNLIFKEVPFQPYLRYTVWLVFLESFSCIPLVIYRAREQATHYSIFTISRFLLSAISIITFVVWLKQGPWGYLQGRLWAEGILALVFLSVMVRNVRVQFDLQEIRGMLRYGLPLLPHAISAWILNLSDRVLLERFTDLSEVGRYSLGYQMASIMNMVLTSVNFAWVPFYLDSVTRDEKKTHRILPRIITLYTVFISGLGLSFALLMKEAILLVAAPAFHDAYRVVPIVVLGFLFNGLYFMTVTSIFYAKKTHFIPLLSGGAALIQFSLNLFLIPRMGMLGAAWTTLISFAALWGFTYQLSMRLYPVHYEKRRMVAVVVFAIALFFCGTLLNFPVWINISLKSFLILLFFMGLYAAKFFTPEEVAYAREMITSRLQRKA